MFQVLIADDELAVIQSLKESIKWEEFGLQLAGTAMNGYEAIGIAESKAIDIAILDIRMPGVNGLELCGILKKKNTEIQIIIISGYAEFEYAQKAINFGVLGYCLKPLEYSEISRYLLKAVHNLSKDNKTGYEDILELLENDDLETVNYILKRYGFQTDKHYVAASSGDSPVSLSSGDGIVIWLGRGLWGYILKYNFFAQHEKEFILSEENYGLGYMNELIKNRDIFQTLEHCSAMAYQYFVNPKCKIYTHLGQGKANVWLDEIQKYISKNKWDIICAKLIELKNRYLSDFTVRSSLKLCNMIYTSELFRNDTEDYYVYGLKQLVMEYGSLSQMIDEICESIYNIRNNVECEAAFSNTSFLKLIKYVDQNYKENITLTSVAQALNINPNYLSQLFKKEAGINFVHYITQKRLEDAKKLLTSTNKTVTDIAVEVGFNDYFYFLKTFKKVIGVTPSQYRLNE